MKKITCFLFLIAIVLVGKSQDSTLYKKVNELKTEVDKLKNLKISGWVQAQVQFADSVGVANFDGGAFGAKSDKRFMIRRGRIKFTYNGKNSQYVFQVNGTERGFNLTEIYCSFIDPWSKSFSVVAGVMNRPFGFEIDQSSANRESPERSRYTQILMPNERDLGAKIVFAPQKEGKMSKLYGLRLDAGFYNGQGVYVPGTTTPSGFPTGTTPVLGVNEFDYKKDFIGRLSYYKDLKGDKVRMGIGASHYNGGIINQSNLVYNKIEKDAAGILQWKAADSTSTLKGKITGRIYFGGEFFVSVKSTIGTTTIRGEYITGKQPGTSSSTSSPFILPSSTTMYQRNFDGMYAYFIQRIGKSKHEILVKYEWYDPNTDVQAKDLLGSTKNKFTSADIKYTQLGLGYNYYLDEHVKFMVYYNIITNEVTGDGKMGIKGFTKDIPDNILTVRMTYKF
jgi:hypothetical protein